MTIIATIDRFEGDLAVLLVGEEETPVNVRRSDLPQEAQQGDVLRLDGGVSYEATEARRRRAKSKIERLKRRSG